jgi:hypothetical protein
MDMLLFIGLLAVTVYAWTRPKRAHRPATPLPRLSGPSPRRRAPEPFLPSLARFLAQCAVSMKSTARAVQTAVMLELERPARRRYPTMIMSRDDDDADDDEIPATGLLGLGTLEPEPGTHVEPTSEPSQKAATKPDALGKLRAIKTLYEKRLTPEDVEAIQKIDRATIRRVSRDQQIAVKTMAQACGGNYDAKRQQIAAALSEEG